MTYKKRLSGKIRKYLGLKKIVSAVNGTSKLFFFLYILYLTNSKLEKLWIRLSCLFILELTLC